VDGRLEHLPGVLTGTLLSGVCAVASRTIPVFQCLWGAQR